MRNSSLTDTAKILDIDRRTGSEWLKRYNENGIEGLIPRYNERGKKCRLSDEQLKELEEAGKLDDTVIVLFGDHYPYALADDEFQSLADYDINENQETDRTPFIIYNSATDAEKITKVTTPLDYTPTLLNLFGIEYDPRLYMGHDIFSDYDDYAVFPDNSWQSREGFYSSTKGLFIPKNDDISLDDETIISRNEEINTMRNMSALAIRNNYFNYLLSEMYGGSLEESTEEGEE